MARRPRARVDTSRLRAMGETSAVVARPVDTYVRPAAPQKNEQYAQILSALSTVNPALDTFIADKVTKDRETQANKGEKSFYEASPEERKAVSAQIKNGEINELQSPFWVEGFARSLLRNHATTFGSALTLEWNRQKDSGGFDFNAFVAEERGKYVEANNLSSFRSDLFNDEFAAVTQTFENQVLQRNFEHRIAQAKKARMQSLGDSMSTVIQGMQEALDTEAFDGQKGDTYSAQINAEIQTAIDQGLDPSGVISMAEGFLKGTIFDLAQNEQNQDIAKGMLRNLKLKSGTYGIVYKDKYEAIERSADSIMLRAETDAEQADDDALTAEKENLFGQLYDGLNKAIDNEDNPTAVQDFWEANTDNLRRIGKLDEFTDGDMLPTLNKLYKTRGKITPDVTDEEMLDLLEGVDKNNTYTSQEMQTLAEDMGLSASQFIAFQNYNRDRPNQFLKEIGINGVRKALTDGIDAKGMFEFGPQGGISLGAVEARGKLNAYIKSQLSLDATKETKIANILAESQRLIEEYGNKAKNTTVQQLALDSAGTPTASEKTVEKFEKGTHAPWKKPNGSMVLSDTASAVEAFNKATKKGQPLDSTEFGALILPLLKAGVPLDTILDATLADFEASLGLQDDKAIEEIKGFFPELTTDVTQPSTRSTREPVSAVEFAQELVEKGSELVNGALGGKPATNEPMFKASDGEFFNDGKGSLTEKVVGSVVDGVSDLISGETDTAVAADAALEKAQQHLSPEAKARIASGTTGLTEQVVGSVVNGVSKLTSGTGDRYSSENPMFEASDGQFFDRGTVELPPSIQGGLLSQEDYDAMAVDAQQRIDEKATAIQAEAIGNVGSPRDRIGDINTAIVDLGEGFVKAVARSFEATGKAGVEVAAKLLAEEPDPDKALAAAQKYLSPEAKIRIQNVSKKFGSQKAADAALVIAQQYLSDTAKTRIDTGETGQPVSARANKVIADEDQVMNAAFPQPRDPQPKVSDTETETVNNIRSIVNLTGKVPSLSSIGENLPKRAAWRKAFGANFKPNGAAKPVFIRKALEISKATDTDVTAVIKAVMGKEQTAEEVFVTSGLSMSEAQKLYEKNQEIRKLFEQMQGGNS